MRFPLKCPDSTVSLVAGFMSFSLCPFLRSFSKSKLYAALPPVEFLLHHQISLPFFNGHGFAGRVEDALRRRCFDLLSSKHCTRTPIGLLLRLLGGILLLPGHGRCSLSDRSPGSCACLLSSGIPELCCWEATERCQHLLPLGKHPSSPSPRPRPRTARTWSSIRGHVAGCPIHWDLCKSGARSSP